MDLIQTITKLQELPSGTHWFCPRCKDEGFYFLEDLATNPAKKDDEKERQRRQKLVDEAKERQKSVLQAFQILAYDGEEAALYRSWVEDQLPKQLRCEVCVREFHRLRRELKQQLDTMYEEDDVSAFFERFDEITRDRIRRGLKEAEETLEKKPLQERRMTALSYASLYTLLELLHCNFLLADEQFLADNFDRPFGWLQANSSLKLNNYPPAMTYFLFQTNRERNTWATKSWTRFKQKNFRNITATEFEYGVREPLLNAMGRVRLELLDLEFFTRFWTGVRLIVDKLDKDLITHSLRAMDMDVCFMALDHLQVDRDGFKSILATVKKVLETSPQDFWDALGTVPAATWIEQFYNSSAFKRLVSNISKSRPEDQELQFNELFSWMTPYLSSLKPVHQPDACRHLVEPLFGKFQEQPYDKHFSEYCFKTGLELVRDTLYSLNIDNVAMINRVEAKQTLDLVSSQLRPILKGVQVSSSHSTPAAELLRQALSLDVKCLSVDQGLLAANKPLPHKTCTVEKGLWKQIIDSLHTDNLAFATRFILGVRDVVGLEKFVTKAKLTLETRLVRFNEALDTVSELILEFLEKLNDFDPEKIQTIFDDESASTAFIGLLFSSDDGVRNTVVDIVKTVSDKTSRRDAFADALNSYFESVLTGFTAGLRRIDMKNAFTPARGSLVLLRDVLDILCDSSSGLLRTLSLDQPSRRALELFWGALWQELAKIFSFTEQWNNLGHDKELMMKFCQDVMDFAAHTFDQFPVFSSALHTSDQSKSDKDVSEKRLTESPSGTMEFMVKWLRLRDDHLLNNSTKLICDILKRLKQFDVKVDMPTLKYVESVITRNTKTVLRQTQIAELYEAMETHMGAEAYGGMRSDQTKGDQMKPKADGKAGQIDKAQYKTGGAGTIDFAQWSSHAQGAQGAREKISSDKFTKSLTPAAESLKQQQGAAGKSALAGMLSSKPPSARPSQWQADSKAKQISEFKERRERDIAAKKQRDEAARAALRKNNALGGSEVKPGSGLSKLGIDGVEHSDMKGTGMMVSSDSDSDDSDASMNSLDRELFGGASKKSKQGIATSAPKKRETSKELPKPPRPQVPFRKQRLQRSAADMRARLAPDLEPLHREILAWNYFHEGDFPPTGSVNKYASVENKFRDAHMYQSTFQPLLTLEAWQGFCKDREENHSKPYEVKVSNRTTVDSWLETSTIVPVETAKEISEGDIVLLAKINPLALQKADPNCLARVHRILRRGKNVEVLYRTLPSNTMAQNLKQDAIIQALKVTSIIPLEREFGALRALQYYDLCDEITKGLASPLLNYSDEKLQPLMKTYQVNRAQAKAIQSAIDNDAFTLIQGPPGSGKTKTIIGIVGAILTGSRAAQAQDSVKKKLLVCAPSNAAVDELVMRFKEGVRFKSGADRKINVVRVGRSDAINSNVQDVTLDELVNKRLSTSKAAEMVKEETAKLMKQHQEVSMHLQELRSKLDDAEKKGAVPDGLRQSFNAKKKEKASLSQKIDESKDRETQQSRAQDQHRRKIQQQIIEESNVVCATLSGSGHDMFQHLSVEFDTVIVDEAAQCVELSSIIPLKYGCVKCIMVGDPQQLPPTVFSREAANYKYEQSLFVRMQANAPENVHLLDTQYRMHPEISAFPSQAFYDNRLLDGPDMAKLRVRPWHAAEVLGPFRFFDVHGQHESAPRGHSLINRAEINVAMKLYARLLKDFPNVDFDRKVGIITPYKSQLRELRDRFRDRFGQNIGNQVEFNTTDAFQGRESEIIIFSCVRASPSGGIGFLNDIRRMNVGLTRAKSSLWVLGNSQSLMNGRFWKSFVEHAKSSGRFTDQNVDRLFDKPLAKTDVQMSGMDQIAQPKTSIDQRSASYHNNISSGGLDYGSPDPPSNDMGVGSKRKISAGSDVSMDSKVRKVSTASDVSIGLDAKQGGRRDSNQSIKSEASVKSERSSKSAKNERGSGSGSGGEQGDRTDKSASGEDTKGSNGEKKNCPPPPIRRKKRGHDFWQSDRVKPNGQKR